MNPCGFNHLKVGNIREEPLHPLWDRLVHLPPFSGDHLDVCGLMLGFYRNWELVTDDVPILPFKKSLWGRDFLIAVVAVFMFEIMAEPMVENVAPPDLGPPIP